MQFENKKKSTKLSWYIFLDFTLISDLCVTSGEEIFLSKSPGNKRVHLTYWKLKNNFFTACQLLKIWNLNVFNLSSQIRSKALITQSELAKINLANKIEFKSAENDFGFPQNLKTA